MVDSLDSEDTTAALSANQGRVLKKMIEELPSGGGGITEEKEVYIGEEEPTDDGAKLWIDPTGTPSQPSQPSAGVEVIDNLESESTTAALSANQGRVLKEMIVQSGGGGSITLDSEMSDTSTNAVSNKVIKEYVDNAVAQGGGGAMSNYPLVYVEDSVAELEMQPNTMYFIMTPRTLKLTLGEPVPNIVNEYCLLMVGGGANAPVTLPDSHIIWAGGNAPAFAEYALYEISMVYVQGILFGVSAEFSLM